MTRYTPPGHIRSVEAFAACLRALDPEVDCATKLLGGDGPLGQPISVYGRTVGNRFAVQPMEGWDAAPDGLPSEHTLRRWRHFGESGAKLIWGGEAFAVQYEGRANPNQLFLNPDADIEQGLRSLLDEISTGHAAIGETTDDLLIGLQLTHSGRFSRPDASGPKPRIVQHHPVLADKYGLAGDLPLVTDTELKKIGESFVRAAELAQRVGFDFVDVKCCHGYLLHELLGAHTRSGPYGGSFENRTRLFRRIVEGIRTECPGLAIAVRISITDVYPFTLNEATGLGEPQDIDKHKPYRYGFGVQPDAPLEPDFHEPMRFLELLRSLDIRLVNITIGSPYYCPHVQRPARYPPSDGYLPPEDPLRSVVRHLNAVRTCKRAFPDLVFVGSGYSYLQEYLPHVAQAQVGAGHVDFIGLGRMILPYPQFPRDVLSGAQLRKKKLCRTFSDCTTAPRNAMISGCYPLDAHYKQLPQATELRLIKKAHKTPVRRST